MTQIRFQESGHSPEGNRVQRVVGAAHRGQPNVS